MWVVSLWWLGDYNGEVQSYKARHAFEIFVLFLYFTFIILVSSGPENN